MIKQRNEFEELRMLLDTNFRILDKKISRSNRQMEALIKKIIRELVLQENQPVFEERDIKIVSYADD